MKIKKIILKDQIIDDPTLVDFIAHSIGQRGAFQGVIDNLKRKDLDTNAKYAEESLKKATGLKKDTLQLENLTAQNLRELCQGLIDILEDYGDLETIMAVDHKAASKLINSI